MTTPISTAREMWQRFERMLPPDAPDVQRREMRRAFYGGAYSVMIEMLQIADYDEAEGAQKLEQLRREIKSHIEVMILQDKTQHDTTH